MRPSLARACFAGFVATFSTTLLMYGASPRITGGSLDIAGMAGGLLGASWIAGILGHLVTGAFVLPVAYAALALPRLAGPAAWRGMVWGVALWAIAQVAVMPLAGAGFFSAEAGGLPSAISSLLGHVFYGLTLGELCGVGRIDGHRRAIHGRPAMGSAI